MKCFSISKILISTQFVQTYTLKYWKEYALELNVVTILAFMLFEYYQLT